MNLADGQRVKGILESSGYSETDDQEEADLILFLTCCVREHAEERLFGRVASLRNLKERNPDLIIGLGGCLVQEHRTKLFTDFPFVDILFGPNDIEDIPGIISELPRSKKNTGNFKTTGNFLGEHPDGVVLHRSFSAFVNIIRGCTNNCTYCIVPKVRGPEVSRAPEEIISFVKGLVQKGVTEITLLGQNVIAYGRDIGIREGFAHLVEKLNDIENLKWIRFLTSHPRDFSKETIERLSHLEKVCEAFHLPFQAGSNRVLKAMNRGYTRENYFELIDTVKRFFPVSTVTTDVICGFPSETEDEFDQTLDLIRQVRFDSAFMYFYSPRSGTPAESMKGNLPEDVRKERLTRLIDLQNRISMEISASCKGKTFEVLVEGDSRQAKGQLIGKCRGGRSIDFDGTSDLIGSYVKVRVDRSRLWTLSGSIVT
jgi:tRNA-2-methylthio-N6-dimethylallyladenosine synthase